MTPDLTTMAHVIRGRQALEEAHRELRLAWLSLHQGGFGSPEGVEAARFRSLVAGALSGLEQSAAMLREALGGVGEALREQSAVPSSRDAL